MEAHEDAAAAVASGAAKPELKKVASFGSSGRWRSNVARDFLRWSKRLMRETLPGLVRLASCYAAAADQQLVLVTGCR